MKPSFTLTYGLGWNLEMPPYELIGNAGGARGLQRRNRSVPKISSRNVRRGVARVVLHPDKSATNWCAGVGSGLKYPYNPYYGEFSPRASFAWNPHYSDGILGKVFGNGKTVVRGGYSRIFGRLNGVDLVLVPLLGPAYCRASPA